MHWFNKLLKKGHRAGREERAKAELEKIGVLRGGNAGLVTPDGKWYGGCGRKAALRALSLDLPPDMVNTLDQFEGGYANEDIISKLLTQAGEGHLREEEVPVAWKTSNGFDVTGRPDIVLTKDNKPDWGIELKSIVSIWSAMGKHYDLKPDSTNMIQAAHYSWQLGNLPWLLVYSNRSQFHLSTAPKFLRDKFPPGVYDVEYKKDKPSQPMKMVAFNRTYELRWREDGFLTYQTEGMPGPAPTCITAKGIERFYTEVGGYLRGTHQLPARPEATSVDGSKSYKACAYCSLKDTCDSFEEQPEIWRDEVELKIQEINEKFDAEMAET